MGKKILSKVRHSIIEKNHNIKKPPNTNSKHQTKNNTKKQLSVSKNKNIKSTSGNKSKTTINSKTVNTNTKSSIKGQSSIKKSTTKPATKSGKLQKVQKFQGVKKITVVQKKKSQKNQRQLCQELDKNLNENQQKSQSFILKNELPPLAIYREEVPDKWRESIIRYHEAKMERVQIQKKDVFNLGQNAIIDSSEQPKINKTQWKRSLLKAKKPVEQNKNIPVRKSLRKQNSKRPLMNNRVHEVFSPQIIEISSQQHHSIRQHHNFQTPPLQGENHCQQNTSKDHVVFKDNNNNESVSDSVRKVFQKSQSKSSYSYEVASLSPSKHNSINQQIIQFPKKTGKLTQNLYQHSSSPHSYYKVQSQSISSHSIDPEYIVQRIVSSKIKRNATLYEIKWVGYSEEQNTFEPLKNLKNIMEMVLDFQKRQKQTFKQNLKEKQKILAEKNKQLAQKNKQLSFKTKKLDEMKNKYEELIKKVRDLQKQKKLFTKIEKSSKLKVEQNIKSEIHQQKRDTKVQFVFPSENTRINSLEQNIEKLCSNKRLNDTNTSEKDNNEIIEQQNNPSISDRYIIKQQFIKRQKPATKQIIIEDQNVEEQEKESMMEEEEHDEIVFPLQNQNILKVDDFDHGHIHSDLQLVEYSFPFFANQLNDKMDKMKKLIQQEQTIIQEQNLQNHSLMEEYDCLKYFCSEH